MKNINKEVGFSYKLAIYFMALKKLIRGFAMGFFFFKKKYPIFIGKHVSITQKSNIIVGRNVKFEDYSEIQALSKEPITFADNVTIGRGTMIRPSSYYGIGNIGMGLKIGKNSSIGPGGYIGCAGRIIIGENVLIGPKVSMFAENHNFSDKVKTIKSQGVNNKGIVIENNCWIGSNVIILDGVTIKSGSVIGGEHY
ncbi:acyltransferase [Liquorilactobacillus vini]|uniref:Acetyltransferase YncA n=1 Tax=Liquorilactobacillus vini DSM 20605 TaxID=1133569 RepID=A0A0R2CCL2_9LACO|nr:acyltransferase [Liquorilactobacillus vini]KRM85203.1 acetyltransferase YncA [Liquorilactobacillus vini DSM 20605]